MRSRFLTKTGFSRGPVSSSESEYSSYSDDSELSESDFSSSLIRNSCSSCLFNTRFLSSSRLLSISVSLSSASDSSSSGASSVCFGSKMVWTR